MQISEPAIQPHKKLTGIRTAREAYIQTYIVAQIMLHCKSTRNIAPLIAHPVSFSVGAVFYRRCGGMSMTYDDIDDIDDIDDKKLVELLFTNLDRHFVLLVKKYRRTLYQQAYQKTGSQQDADDVTQEALIKAYKALKNRISRQCADEKCPAEKKHAEMQPILNLRAWLMAVLYSALMDFYRRTRYRSFSISLHDLDSLELLEDDRQYWPDNVIEALERREKIIAAIENLPELYQKPAYLRYIEGLSEQKVIEHFSPPVPPNTVRTWLRRARNLLRKMLKSDMYGEEE